MLNIQDDNLGITCSNGILVIKAHNSTLIIKEQPMATFEQFYRLWQTGVQLGGSNSFSVSWTNNQQFRDVMSKALNIIGIKNPEMLTPSQLEALLLSYQKENEVGPELIPGILFGLHHTFPKLDTSMTQKEPPLRMSLKWLLTLTLSMLLDITSQTSWKTHILKKGGLFLVSCGIWAIKSLTQLMPALNPEINISKPDGQSQSEIVH